MRISFCGVRGSTHASGDAFRRVGGHTCCVAVSLDGAHPTLVLDAGSGIRSVTDLMDGQPFRGAIVLGHLHWDHLFGLPFFAAADTPDAATEVFMPEQGRSAESLLAHIMQPPFFPIGPRDLRGTWRFSTYDEGAFRAGGFEVRARQIPHKGGRTMGLRVSDGRHSIAYLSDHAPQDLGPGPDGAGARHAAAVDLVSGVDVLIHDAQYTAEELPVRGAFGHAAAEHAVRLGREAGAKRVLLFHHDPSRTDDEVDAIVSTCRAEASLSGAGSLGIGVDAATEGMIIDL